MCLCRSQLLQEFCNKKERQTLKGTRHYKVLELRRTKRKRKVISSLWKKNSRTRKVLFHGITCFPSTDLALHPGRASGERLSGQKPQQTRTTNQVTRASSHRSGLHPSSCVNGFSILPLCSNASLCPAPGSTEALHCSFISPWFFADRKSVV